jgi:hypothetical protein
MARQQAALHVGPDHVVGRASDQVHVADRLGVISKRAKGSNLWHPCSLAAEWWQNRRNSPAAETGDRLDFREG